MSTFAVSIHAPVRGATIYRKDSLSFQVSVSIHAPVRGATYVYQMDRGTSFVSIHAPVRGATSSSATWPWPRNCFNPRAREGRDRAHTQGTS